MKQYPQQSRNEAAPPERRLDKREFAERASKSTVRISPQGLDLSKFLKQIEQIIIMITRFLFYSIAAKIKKRHPKQNLSVKPLKTRI